MVTDGTGLSGVNLPEDVYDVTSSGHLTRAIDIRKRFVKVNPLQFGLYAALELRNAIERLLFEYLVLIQGENVSKRLEKEYRVVSFKKYIEDIEPELQKKIEYTNLLLRAAGMPPAVVPDFDALSNLYGNLNNYLHAWKRPQKTVRKPEWWKNLFQVLDETESILKRTLSGTIGHIKFNEKGWKDYQAWKNNDLSDQEVIEFFRRELQKKKDIV